MRMPPTPTTPNHRPWQQLRHLNQIARLAHTYRTPPPTKESFALLETLDWYKMLGGE